MMAQISPPTQAMSNQETVHHRRTHFEETPLCSFCRHLEDRTPLSSLPLAPPIAHPASPGIYQVANGTLFGPAGPVYTDVAQGNLGDCWLVASFAEAAARDSQLIRNMFTYLGVYRERGVAVQLYDVRFYDKNGQVKTVLVDNKFPMMRGTEYNDQVRNGVLWVALAEKAYVEAASLGYVTNSHTQTHVRVSDSYTDVVAGDALWALIAITGQAGGEAYNFPGDNIFTNTFSGSNVAAEMAAGNMVVIGTGFTTTNPAIVGGHAYVGARVQLCRPGCSPSSTRGTRERSRPTTDTLSMGLCSTVARDHHQNNETNAFDV